MGSDEDGNLPRGNAAQRLLPFLALRVAEEQANPIRGVGEELAEILIMLLRQRFGRGHQSPLAAAGGIGEEEQGGNQRLPRSDVPLQKAIHGGGLLHVLQAFGNRGFLRVRQRIRQRMDEASERLTVDFFLSRCSDGLILSSDQSVFQAKLERFFVLQCPPSLTDVLFAGREMAPEQCVFPSQKAVFLKQGRRNRIRDFPLQPFEALLDQIPEKMLWIAIREGINRNESLFWSDPAFFEGKQIQLVTSFVKAAP